MKKVLTLFAVVALTATFTSCKKDWTCKCTSTTTFDGGSETDEFEYELKESTKAEAKIACPGATYYDENEDGTVTNEESCELESK